MQPSTLTIAAAGVPLTVAKSILSDPSFLIGVCAPSSDVATAAIADGASFVIVQSTTDEQDTLPLSVITETVSGVRSGLQIPLLASASGVAPPELSSWVSEGLDGVYGTVQDLAALAQKNPASSDPVSVIAETLSSVSAQLERKAPIMVSWAPQQKEVFCLLLHTMSHEREDGWTRCR